VADYRCTRAECYIHEGEGCELGNRVERCPHATHRGILAEQPAIVRDDRGMWHPERIREQLRARLLAGGLGEAELERAARLAEGLVQAGSDDPVGGAIARLPSGAQLQCVVAGPEPGEVSLGYTLTQVEADAHWRTYGQPTDADFDAFHELIVGYVRKRAPKPPRRGKARRSRQVRSTRARAKLRVEQRVALVRPGRGRWSVGGNVRAHPRRACPVEYPARCVVRLQDLEPRSDMLALVILWATVLATAWAVHP